MYRRGISIMARPPPSSRNPLTSSSNFHCAPRRPLTLPERAVTEVSPGILLHLYEILARVHSLLVLDEKPGDGALFLSLDLVERFHDLDQAYGISGRDLVALLDVGVALRIGTTVEGARHLRSDGLVGQLTSSFRSRDLLLSPTKRPDLDVVLLKLPDDGLGQTDGAGGVPVYAHGVRGHFYVLAALRSDLALGHGPDNPIADLLGVEVLGHCAGEFDLAVVVVLAIGVELRRHRLIHPLRQLVGHGGLHAEEQKPRVDPLYRLDDRARELLVAGSDHVEGAVGFYVLDLHVVVAGELAQGAKLVDQLVLDVVRRHLHLPPPEAHQVPIPRVYAHGDSALLGERDGLAHSVGVAGVEAASDVGGGDVLHHLLIKSHLPRAETLTHVAVEINLHGTHLPLGTRLAQGLLDLHHLLPTLLAGLEGLVEVHRPEAGLVVGLGLGQSVAVRAYDGPDGCVAAASNSVVHQHDGFDPARHLDGADRVPEVHHVRRVGPCPGGLLPFDELQLAALVTVADAVRVRGDGPRGVQELLHALLGQSVAGEADDHTQLRLFGVGGDVILVHGLANPVGAISPLPDLQLVAFLQSAPLEAAEPDQGVRRAAVHEDGDVYTPRHRQVRPGTAPQVIEGENVAGLHRDNLPARRLFAVYLRRHLGTGDSDEGILCEFQLRAEVRHLQSRRAVLVAYQVVTDLVRKHIHSPRRRHPDGVLPEAARVLNGGEESRLPDPKSHRAPPGSPRYRRAGPRASGPDGRPTPSFCTRRSPPRPRPRAGRTPRGLCDGSSRGRRAWGRRWIPGSPSDAAARPEPEPATCRRADSHPRPPLSRSPRSRRRSRRSARGCRCAASRTWGPRSAPPEGRAGSTRATPARTRSWSPATASPGAPR